MINRTFTVTSRRWRQQLALRADNVAGLSSAAAAPPAPAAGAPQPSESNERNGQWPSTWRSQLLTVQSRAQLHTVVHKGVEGSLCLLPDGASTDDEFIFAGPSHQPASCTLHEWLQRALTDLTHRLPLAALPPIARAAVDLHRAALDDAITLSRPFTVRLTDPRRESSLGPPPAAAEPHAAPCRDLAAIGRRLAAASKVIVMVGAGASVSAGIPDFR